MICHGRSSATAIANGIRAAAGYVSHHVSQRIADGLRRLALSGVTNNSAETAS